MKVGQKTKAVLLDLGGTVLDFQGDPGIPSGKLDFRGREALLRYVNARGAGLTEEDLDRDLFGPWRRGFDRRAELGREEDWTPHLRRLRKRGGLRTPTRTLLRLWFRPLAEQVEPMPGAAAAIAELVRRKVRLAIVSNAPLPGALYVPILERHDLARHFDHMVFSYDEGHRKPSPALVRRALAGVSASPLEALMVGDRRSIDVLAGRAAGVRTIWLRSEDGGGPAADAMIEHMSELPSLV